MHKQFEPSYCSWSYHYTLTGSLYAHRTHSLTIKYCCTCPSALPTAISIKQMVLKKLLQFTFSLLLPSMDPPAAAFLLLLLASLFSYPFVLLAHSPTPTISRISVVGVVYCDTCSTSTFSKQSYFLPGKVINYNNNNFL